MSSAVAVVDYLILDPESPYLQAQACRACDALYFDRRNACAHCGGRKFSPRRLADTGRLTSYTIIYRGAPGIPTPYTSAVVSLDGGGVVKANLLGVENDAAQIKLNQRVRLTTFIAGKDDEGTQAVAFGYEPEEE
jgi:uncharacterized OB-fold protein